MEVAAMEVVKGVEKAAAMAAAMEVVKGVEKEEVMASAASTASTWSGHGCTCSRNTDH